MKIYTKTGDKGETGLLGGERVTKDSLRLNAYGTIDELNAFIGLTITEVKSDEVKNVLVEIQNKLFSVGSDLAAPENAKSEKLGVKRTPENFVSETEKSIDYFESKLDQLKNFILPGGTKSAALLHICRTITRRAEREIVALKNTVPLSDNILTFINRISDLFFVLSRFENKYSKIPDTIWKSK